MNTGEKRQNFHRDENSIISGIQASVYRDEKMLYRDEKMLYRDEKNAISR